jgi:hypothetical protein
MELMTQFPVSIHDIAPQIVFSNFGVMHRAGRLPGKDAGHKKEGRTLHEFSTIFEAKW